MLAAHVSVQPKRQELHPEALPGEICIGNIYGVDFRLIRWTTKRMGKVPYSSTTGEPLKGGQMRPVFVSRREIEDAGVAIPVFGPIDHRW